MAARPGRPAVGERIAIRLPEPLLADIDRRATADGRSRAATIRELLAHAIAYDDRSRRPVDPAVSSPREPTGVDLAQIRRALRMTPAERVRHNAIAVNRIRRLQGAANR